MMKRVVVFIAVAAVIGGAVYFIMNHKSDEKPVIPPRYVQTTTITHGYGENALSLTGEIRSENEVGLGFRVDGQMVSRPVSLGDVITPGQIVATLDSQDMANELVAAKADLAAAEAEFIEATSSEQRQRTLYQQGVAPQARYEEAQRALGVTQARVEAAKAHVKLAEDQLSYTKLRAEVGGAVTETVADAGEVVRAGQVVIRIAQEGGRDAIFNVPEGLMQPELKKDNLKIDISLSNNPDVHTEGYIREVSPQADPITRTFTVKVGLIDPPAEMRLGSVVTGKATSAEKAAVIRIPSSAMNREAGEPAVWVVDSTNHVNLRPITVTHYEQNAVIVNGGLEEGDVIVTAGVHSLHPGQEVKVAGEKPETAEPPKDSEETTP